MAVFGNSLISHKEVFAPHPSRTLDTAHRLALWLPGPIKSALRHYSDMWALSHCRKVCADSLCLTGSGPCYLLPAGDHKVVFVPSLHEKGLQEVVSGGPLYGLGRACS